MRILLTPGPAPRSGSGSPPGDRWTLQPVDDAGTEVGEPLLTDDLAATVSRFEADHPRWVWTSTTAVYPQLLRAGVRVERGHDLELTEALLCAHEERPYAGPAAPTPGHQASLFDVTAGAGGDEPHRWHDQHAAQRERIERARVVSPGFELLVAAESAAALAAAEMGEVGLPWRADVHDQVLTDLLGERPRHGGRPPKLQELAVAVADALDDPQLNVDSPLELLKAFRRQGLAVRTTRAHELRTVEHPAIEPLLRYKELVRLHVAHGWAWRETWVRSGRFRPEYVPGGVVSGRWATRGGGALQIPRVMRAPVVADPGWALVVADAGQLEPRLLAALSGDPGMVAATADGDLYTALARQALGRPEARAEAKIALLAAMYGARANTPAMAALRRRFPRALALLETAARTGEDGGIVRSVLGRTCPPPEEGWQEGPDEVLLNRSQARGRFTRNFVIQASAADWANVLVAGLRSRLTALRPGPPRADLVLFQHDEVVVHTPQELVADVVAAITDAGREATRLVIGERGVRIPLDAVPVASYADKP
jgi:DNA polymerase I